MKVKSENEVAQSCPTLCNPMDCSLLGSPVPGIFQARGLEWDAIASSLPVHCQTIFYCTDRGNVLLVTDIFLSPFPLSARLPANTNTLDGELFLFFTHPLGGALPSTHTQMSLTSTPASHILHSLQCLYVFEGAGTHQLPLLLPVELAKVGSLYFEEDT